MPAGTGKVGPANPGTKAIQHYLNTKHGQKLDVDGRDGPLTTAAIRSLSGKLSTDEYANIAGLAYAYNVLPGQPGTVSLGNPEFVKRMTALGYNPKTGDPISGGGQSASPAAGSKPSAGGITPGQNARDDLLARQGKAGQAASPSAGGVPPDADKKQPYWVNGTRYEYKMSGGGRGRPAIGKWEVTATPQDKLQWNATRGRSMNKYTGPDDGFDSWMTAQRQSKQQAASPAKESIDRSEDDAILAMIRAVR